MMDICWAHMSEGMFFRLRRKYCSAGTRRSKQLCMLQYRGGRGEGGGGVCSLANYSVAYEKSQSN